MDSKAKEFGKYLKNLRKKKGLTLVQLKEATSMSQPYLSQMENGLKGIPSPETLKKLEAPLGVSHFELMVRAGHLKQEITDIKTTLKNFKQNFLGNQDNFVIGEIRLVILRLVHEIQPKNSDEEKKIREFLKKFDSFIEHNDITSDELLSLLPEEKEDPYIHEASNIRLLISAIDSIREREATVAALSNQLEASKDLLSYIEEPGISINGHDLTEEDRKQALDMLKILFRKYIDV